MNIKRFRKIGVILSNSVNKTVAPLFAVIISLVVIREYGATLWGDFVVFLLITNLIYQVLVWGHRDYLLKEFSKNPSQNGLIWSSNLMARSVLLLLALIGVWFFSPIPSDTRLWWMLWIASIFLLRSFDVIILYEKKFATSTLVEVSIFLIMIVVTLYGFQTLNIKNLVIIYALGNLSKALIMTIIYRSYWHSGASPSLGLRSLQGSLPFFLPAVMAFVQGKIDIYFVALVMSESALGQYQVLMNFLLMATSIISFSVTPFIKNIYRLKEEVIYKLNRLVSLYGVVISLISITFIYLALTWYYRFNLNLEIYLVALVQMIPFSLFQIKIYQLYKYEKQYLLVWLSLSLMVINLGTGLLLIPPYGLLGALCTSAIAQWASWAVLFSAVKRYQPKTTAVNHVH